MTQMFDLVEMCMQWYVEQTLVWLQTPALIINHQTFSVAVKSLGDEVSWKIFPQFSGSLMGVWEHLKLLTHWSMSCSEVSI